MGLIDTVMWVSGELVPARTASVSARDHGLVVGDGAFEAAKVVRGEVFALRRHLDRMDRTIAGLGLPPVNREMLMGAVGAVIAANAEALTGDYDLLRITYTAGPGPLGSPRGEGPPTLILGVTPGNPAPEPTTQIITVPWPRNERGALAGLKTTSYAENVVALARANEAGASEAIFPNTRGELCEGTGSNIVVAVDGRLVTPPLSSGCLAGVTRDLMLDWCEISEQTLPMTALTEADEVFLCSSGRDVQAVLAIDGRQVGDGAIGPLTRQAARDFAAGQRRGLNP